MIEYQRLIMADRVRTQAFEKALRRTVKPGSVVLDVGSGTGFLAFLARKLGASKCILIEREPEFLAMSKEIAKRSGITGCEFIGMDSRDVKKKIVADVVVSETLGNFAYEENTIETLRDARRFLRKGGIMIPRGVRMIVAPVIDSTHWKQIAMWDDVGYGIDWSPVRTRSINNMYVKSFLPEHLLPAKQWDTVQFLTGKLASVREGSARWEIGDPTTIYGLCLSWECELTPGVTIATHASAPATHWQQIFLPAQLPLQCKAGDAFECTIHSDSRPSVKINVQWQLRHFSDGKCIAEQAMDMRKGM